MKSKFSLFMCYFLLATMLFSQNVALAANQIASQSDGFIDTNLILGLSYEADIKISKYPKTPKTITTSLKKTAREKLNRIQSLSDNNVRQYELLASAASLNEAREFAEIYGGSIASYSAQSGIATIKTKKYSLEEAMSLGAHDDSYPPVFPNLVYGTDATKASDPSYSEQYFHTDMNVPAAWDKTSGKSSIIVAVIDTGVDYNHEDLKARISPLSYNSNTRKVGKKAVKDTNGHGTHVAGIIAATANNKKGGAGVAPGVTIMAIKANQGSSGKFSSSDLIDGIYYAVKNGADIINLSLGRNYSYGADSLEHKAIKYAVNSGVTVLAAAGNDKNNKVDYPAAYSEIISVSALKEGNVFDASYSNYGSALDVSAPGTKIYSTVPGNKYALYNGTSMATPAVSGVVALIKSIYPNAQPSQIMSLLRSSAVDKGSKGFDVYYGYGAVNAGTALKSKLPNPIATPKPTATPNPIVTPKPTSFPTTPSYTVNLDLRGGGYPISMTVTRGSLIKEPAPPTKYKDIFIHWADAKGNTWMFAQDRVYSDVNLYAVWYSDYIPTPTSAPPTPTPTPATVYTVTFDSRGGSYVPGVSVVSGRRISEPTPPIKYKDIFIHWVEEDRSVWTFNYNTVYDDVTLYAVWYSDYVTTPTPEPTSTPVYSYTVNFDSKGGDYIPDVTVASDSLIDEPPPPTKYNDTFLYWQTVNNYPWAFYANRVYNNMTLYAVWYSDYVPTPTPSVVCTVNFDSKGGDYIPNITVASGSLSYEPTPPKKLTIHSYIGQTNMEICGDSPLTQ